MMVKTEGKNDDEALSSDCCSDEEKYIMDKIDNYINRSETIIKDFANAKKEGEMRDKLIE